jgi:ABC-type nitrate/sulfonate/bicarbonate transport system substrate-binding protein
LFWASTREFASKNPAVLSAFKASLADGVAYAEANPDKAKADALDEFKVPSSIIKYDLSLEPADFTYFAGVLQTLGMLHGPVDAAKDIA